MKMYFVEKFSEGDTDMQLAAMRRYFTFSRLEEADVIYCASIVKMGEAIRAKSQTGKPLVVYCWDYYLWAHEGKHHDGSNWKAYAQFLKDADLVLVPSRAQQRRLKELLDVKSVVVRSGIRHFGNAPRDDGFILDPLRYYAADENHKWAEQAAAELNIPIIHTEHQYNDDEFRDLMAACTFMTSCVREASTGALSLMEGLWMGKVSLVSNSPYMGANDYVGPYGEYFQYDDFEDLKAKMQSMWERRPTVELHTARNYMHENFTYAKMAQEIYESIHRNI